MMMFRAVLLSLRWKWFPRIWSIAWATVWLSSPPPHVLSLISSAYVDHYSKFNYFGFTKKRFVMSYLSNVQIRYPLIGGAYSTTTRLDSTGSTSCMECVENSYTLKFVFKARLSKARFDLSSTCCRLLEVSVVKVGLLPDGWCWYRPIESKIIEPIEAMQCKELSVFVFNRRSVAKRIKLTAKIQTRRKSETQNESNSGWIRFVLRLCFSSSLRHKRTRKAECNYSDLQT